MIAPTTRLRLARVPLSQIVVTEHQARYPKRLKHYLKLLRLPRNAQSDPGVMALRPYDYTASDSRPLYTLLDGHHRYVAAILCGRRDILALIHYEPGDAGYDDAQPITTTDTETALPIGASAPERQKSQERQRGRAS